MIEHQTWLTPGECADLAGCPTKTVLHAIAAGGLRARRFNRRVILVARQDLFARVHAAEPSAIAHLLPCAARESGNKECGALTNSITEPHSGADFRCRARAQRHLDPTVPVLFTMSSKSFPVFWEGVKLSVGRLWPFCLRSWRRLATFPLKEYRAAMG